MDQVDPQSATDYDDRTTAAVKSVLIEIGQTLGSFQGKFAVIGGAVPWLLLSEAEMPHVGTADVDLTLHAEAPRVGDHTDAFALPCVEHGRSLQWPLQVDGRPAFSSAALGRRLRPDTCSGIGPHRAGTYCGNIWRLDRRATHSGLAVLPSQGGD